MPVFKAYFKVIRQNALMMSIYLIAFMGLLIMLTLFFDPGVPTGFNPAKVRMVLVQEDADHAFSTGLADWLREQTVLVELPDDPQSLQDALFYRDVAYILRIPAGFGASMTGRRYDVSLEKTVVPDSYEAVQMDLQMDKYLNLAALYLDTVPNMTVDQLTASVAADLRQQAAVRLEVTGDTNGPDVTPYFFNFLTYSILAILILGVTSIMLVFNQSDLRRRNLSAPISPMTINGQLMLGHLIFALAVWLSMCLLGLVMTPAFSNPAKYGILCLNALVFALTALSLSLLISQFVANKSVQQSIANLFTIGACFISGVFVPQAMLGKTVLTIASFTPTYWYVRAVEAISRLPSITMDSMKPIAPFLLIQLGFAIAMLAVSLAVVKQKRQTQG